MTVPAASRRRVLAARAGLVVALAAALLSIIGTLTPAPARAADLREFSPGNIITDQVFFDEGSMAPGAIQAFLDDKGSSCVRGSDGTACLRHYRMDTSSRSATTYCPVGYQGAAQETAAMIIYKVAQACRVNPQVLIVTLQKEMGLVRTTNPTAKMYTRAMGYGCPDNSTGVCDSTYNGLQNQLYSAASQYQRYVKNPTNYSYRAGITNYILYHPYNNCGRQAVYIQNGATAALYNYTPYVPNAAALNAGYGTGDGCSSYGNRNFFSYFTDWFGSTQSTGSGAINLKYMALGGSSSSLGLPVAATQCDLAAGGCARAYNGGSIYWSPSSGAAVVQGEVRAGWWANGGITGPMGYPIADSGPITGGAAGAFQGGSVYWSAATGAHAVANELLQNWWNTGGVSGPLGWPVASSGPVTGGKAGAFQNGSIYWSAATGAHWLAGEVRTRYWAMGSNTSELGFPTSDVGPAGSGQAAAFTGGSIYWSAGTGAHAVAKDVLSNWWGTGGISGPLGWPTAGTAAVPGGKSSAFQGGTIYWSPSSGAHWLTGAILARYQAEGAVESVLGFPIGDQGAVPGGEGAGFQGGSVYWSAGTGARLVSGEVRSAWWGRGGVTGPLGFPTTDTGSVDGRGDTKGQVGAFSGGTLYWSAATGGRLLSGDVLAAYVAAGGPEEIGFPVADQGAVTGGTAAAFEDGSIYASAGTGAHVVRGTVRSAWWGRGGITGPLGFPTSDTRSVRGLGDTTGQVGTFSGGALYASSATGARLVSGDVLAAYVAAGGPEEVGFPVADQGAVTGGTAAAFQDGSIYASAGTGAHLVRGEVRSAWWGRGGITGPLGFPTSDTATATGLSGPAGQVGTFSGGALYWSATTGARLVSGDVLAAYVAVGGPDEIGFPVADQGPVTGGTAAAFQDGSIYASAGNGAHLVRGEIRAAYWASGAITGPLGFPTAGTVALSGNGQTGSVATFQRGSIYSSSAGARIVLAAVDSKYRAAGGPASAYGWPTSNTYAVTGGVRNDFQSGQITG